MSHEAIVREAKDRLSLIRWSEVNLPTMSIFCVLYENTLAPLLQSTQLNDEFQMGAV